MRHSQRFVVQTSRMPLHTAFSRFADYAKEECEAEVDRENEAHQRTGL